MPRLVGADEAVAHSGSGRSVADRAEAQAVREAYWDCVLAERPAAECRHLRTQVVALRARLLEAAISDS